MTETEQETETEVVNLQNFVVRRRPAKDPPTNRKPHQGPTALPRRILGPLVLLPLVMLLLPKTISVGVIVFRNYSTPSERSRCRGRNRNVTQNPVSEFQNRSQKLTRSPKLRIFPQVTTSFQNFQRVCQDISPSSTTNIFPQVTARQSVNRQAPGKASFPLRCAALVESSPFSCSETTEWHRVPLPQAPGGLAPLATRA